MKAIIRDHQENRNDTNHDSPIEAGDNRSTSISPVYSMPDEDRYQLTQEPEQRRSDNAEMTPDIDIIDLTNIEDEENFNNKDTNTQTGLEYNIEVEIHRGISKLSLQDIERSLEDKTEDTQCSQSILNNFENIDYVQQNKINSIITEPTVSARVLSNINKPNNVFQTSHLCKSVSANKNKNNKKSRIKIKKGTVPERPKTVCKTKDNLTKTTAAVETGVEGVKVYVLNNKKSNSNKCSITNNFESQRQTCQDTKRTCTINTLNQNEHVTQTPQNKVDKSIRSSEVTLSDCITPTNSYHELTKSSYLTTCDNNPKAYINTQNAPNSKAILHSFKSVASKKIRTHRKKKDTVIAKNTPTLKIKNKKEIITSSDSEQNKNVPIYNENVIDDLSWIENIRYVREIAADESDCKLQLEDDFWDNYYLPANWGDNQFA
ncbi:unnamed protein product [Spodoptera exigua]|nr:unnamed protein product [Spodoptera exigua]